MSASCRNITDRHLKSNYAYHDDVAVIDGMYGKIYYSEDGPEFTEMGNAVDVHQVLTDVFTKEKYLVLRFRDSAGNACEHILARKNLHEIGIKELLAYGVQCDGNRASILIKCIENSERKAPVGYCHSRLGFKECNINGENKMCFFGHRGIGVESRYVGGMQIEPKGSFDEVRSMIEKHVLYRTELETVLAIGASSVVCAYLKDKIGADNVIVSNPAKENRQAAC